jgi:HAE1 family hydrophobic/amphiphilic exporter-1
MTSPPNYRKVNPADSPILTLSAQSDTMPLISVDDYADNFIAQQISQVRGVAQVQIWGEQKPAIRIQVDPAKLASAGLTLEDVRPMLVSSTTIASKGTVNTADTSFTIAANDQIIDAEPFNDAIVAYRNGARSGSAISVKRSPVRPTETSARSRTASAAFCWSCSSSPAQMSSTPWTR